jgi:ribonuclease-3
MTSKQQPALSAALPLETRDQLVRHLAGLGVHFEDEQLLGSVLIHRSFLNERPERRVGQVSNERLEFLGDAVLNLLTAAWLYHTFPERSEGEMTALRAALVKTATLARFANELRLGQYVRISRGEEVSAARERPALLADLFEALLGAIYLDQGIEAAEQFVHPFLQREVERIQTGQADTDYRTRLQELMQARHGITPRYQIVEVAGPDHCRQFTVEVLVEDRQMGVGSGSSKQNASQDAARAALQTLDVQQVKQIEP